MCGQASKISCGSNGGKFIHAVRWQHPPVFRHAMGEGAGSKPKLVSETTVQFKVSSSPTPSIWDKNENFYTLNVNGTPKNALPEFGFIGYMNYSVKYSAGNHDASGRKTDEIAIYVEPFERNFSARLRGFSFVLQKAFVEILAEKGATAIGYSDFGDSFFNYLRSSLRQYSNLRINQAIPISDWLSHMGNWLSGGAPARPQEKKED